MMMIYSCANARVTATQTGANVANATAGICVESLLWDLVEVEKRDVLQAGTIQEETVLWNVMHVK